MIGTRRSDRAPAPAVARWTAGLLAATVALALAARPSRSGEGPPDGTPEGRFRTAGAAYEAGRFQEAEALYRGLLAEGYEDPKVRYNLAGALFKQSRIGEAILEYERVLAADPSDADARENLNFAALLTVDKAAPAAEEFPATVLNALSRRFGSERASTWCLALALLASVVAAAGQLSSGARRRRLALRGAAAVLATAIVCGGLAALQIAAGRGHEHAVVLVPSADARSAPAADATVLFTAHEGLKVEIRGRREGWMQVALPNGLVGWIEAASAEPI